MITLKLEKQPNNLNLLLISTLTEIKRQQSVIRVRRTDWDMEMTQMKMTWGLMRNVLSLRRFPHHLMQLVVFSGGPTPEKTLV